MPERSRIRKREYALSFSVVFEVDSKILKLLLKERGMITLFDNDDSIWTAEKSASIIKENERGISRVSE